MNLKYKTITYSILFFLFNLIYPINIVYSQTDNKIDENALKQEIETIYNKRSESMVTGDLSCLPPYFDTSQKHGQWSLDHEVRRVKYLKDWAYQRGLTFTNINSFIRIKKIYPGKNKLRVALDESYKFDYIYEKDESPTVNSFGVGIRHTLDLVKKNDKFIVYSDWYTDCFEDALSLYSSNIEEIPKGECIYDFSKCTKPDTNNTNISNRYNRIKAVEYADKYCGAAWGSGNDFKYNKKYKDFTGIGGDCTNFASQVLGDKEAGGLKFDGGWYCIYNKYGGSAGSSAWVNADDFKNYVIYSGKGRVIKKGTFKNLVAPNDENPFGPVQKLQLGDLVCYAKNNNMDHFAVVTSFDSHGYPLINSHTTDRYHVPWDLGWANKNIVFHLIHVR